MCKMRGTTAAAADWYTFLYRFLCATVRSCSNKKKTKQIFKCADTILVKDIHLQEINNI